MRSIAIAMLLSSMPLIAAAGPRDKCDSSGADAFREVVTECLVAGMQAGATDPVTLAEACIDAARTIWEVSYPAPWGPGGP